MPSLWRYWYQMGVHHTGMPPQISTDDEHHAQEPYRVAECIRCLGESCSACIQPLALLRCHHRKRNGILFHVLAIALRTTNVVFVMFTEGENQFK